MNIFFWFVKAVSIAGTIFGIFAAIDIAVGTALVQSIANSLASDGYTVSVVSPKGAPKIFAAPEIDGSSASTAIALITCILLLVAERVRALRS